MEPEIQAILDEVPADFQPTFQPKHDAERVVGTLDSLDADTRSIIRGVFYFLVQSTVQQEAHKAEHESPDFAADGVTCERNEALLDALQEKIGTLQQTVAPALMAAFTFQPGELIAFRAEGVIASPPEPEDPFLAMLQSFGAKVVIVGG